MFLNDIKIIIIHASDNVIYFIRRFIHNSENEGYLVGNKIGTDGNKRRTNCEKIQLPVAKILEQQDKRTALR